MDNKQWCWSSDNGNYSSGSFETREDALKDAVTELTYRIEEGETIPVLYLGKASPHTNETMFPDAEIILEHMYLQAEDVAGEWANDYPDCSIAAEAELTDELAKLLTKWCTKHEIAPSFYAVGDVETLDFDLVRAKYENV